MMEAGQRNVKHPCTSPHLHSTPVPKLRRDQEAPRLLRDASTSKHSTRGLRGTVPFFRYRYRYRWGGGGAAQPGKALVRSGTVHLSPKEASTSQGPKSKEVPGDGHLRKFVPFFPFPPFVGNPVALLGSSRRGGAQSPWNVCLSRVLDSFFGWKAERRGRQRLGLPSV
jgi:hypothetical protein